MGHVVKFLFYVFVFKQIKKKFFYCFIVPFMHFL